MRAALLAVLRRDLRVALRQRSDVATGLVFFAVVACLFPLGVGSAPALLREIGPPPWWMSELYR
ncbi:heme exporter protein CcmB [Cylindrospermopsis raciborskii CS-506_C]|nr:heme exporter protein CcmB [Cylindrospermopsis raciborskii CS-506_C]